MEVISKTFKVFCPKLPLDISFIEQKIKEQGLEPLRWAIVEVDKNELTLSVSGRIIN